MKISYAELVEIATTLVVFFVVNAFMMMGISILYDPAQDTNPLLWIVATIVFSAVVLVFVYCYKRYRNREDTKKPCSALLHWRDSLWD